MARQITAGVEAARRHLLGLVVVALAVLVATTLGRQFGLPQTLCGLLIGFGLSFLAQSPHLQAGLQPGINFAASTALRWGIVLLGLQITATQIGSLGAIGFVGLVMIMALVIGAGLLGARLASSQSAHGWIAGGATAICGASAAMAIYAVLGRSRISQEQFTLTLVSITVASALATVAYPFVATSIGLSDRQAGFLMGASIHDVAQSISAGFGYSQSAGEYAAVVKMTRVALLAPLVLIIGLVAARMVSVSDDAQAGQPDPKAKPTFLPWFLIGFFVLLIGNSILPLPTTITEPALVLSKALLLGAVIAVAMNAKLSVLLSQGWAIIHPGDQRDPDGFPSHAWLLPFPAPGLERWPL